MLLWWDLLTSSTILCCACLLLVGVSLSWCCDDVVGRWLVARSILFSGGLMLMLRVEWASQASMPPSMPGVIDACEAKNLQELCSRNLLEAIFRLEVCFGGQNCNFGEAGGFAGTSWNKCTYLLGWSKIEIWTSMNQTQLNNYTLPWKKVKSEFSSVKYFMWGSLTPNYVLFNRKPASGWFISHLPSPLSCVSPHLGQFLAKNQSW